MRICLSCSSEAFARGKTVIESGISETSRHTMPKKPTTGSKGADTSKHIEKGIVYDSDGRPASVPTKDKPRPKPPAEKK